MRPVAVRKPMRERLCSPCPCLLECRSTFRSVPRFLLAPLGSSMPPKKTETKAKAVATTDSIPRCVRADPSSAGAADFEKLGCSISVDRK